VRLTRADAVKFATSVLEATEDTLHYNRCGQLRPTEAAELLKALRAVEFKLSDLRQHPEFDLFEGTGLGDEPADAHSVRPIQPSADPEPAAALIPAIPLADESFAGGSSRKPPT
jgi:hypothetical protein